MFLVSTALLFVKSASRLARRLTTGSMSAKMLSDPFRSAAKNLFLVRSAAVFSCPARSASSCTMLLAAPVSPYAESPYFAPP